MEHEIRCFCSRKPLLALAGVDDKGNGYVHVKSYRQDRLNAEVVVTEGTAQIRCRMCLRWYTIRIVHGDVSTKQEDLPEHLPL